MTDDWTKKWLTEAERIRVTLEPLSEYQEGRLGFARSLAASRALVEEKDTILRAVSDAWLAAANPDELWAQFSDKVADEDGGDLWGRVAEILALREADMLKRLEVK